MKRIYAFALSMILIITPLTACVEQEDNESQINESYQIDESSQINESSIPDNSDNTIDNPVNEEKDPQLFRDEEIKTIIYTSFPSKDSLSFSGAQAQIIVDYISSFEFVPHKLPIEELPIGGCWEISVEYADDKTEVISFLGDRKHIIYNETDYKTSNDAYIELDSFVYNINNANPQQIFSDYLNSMDFDEDMSYSDLKSKYDEYTYNGMPLEEIALYADAVGELFVEWSASCDKFSFVFESSEETHNGYVISNYTLSTSVQLEGMPLPNCITFDDTIEKALQKCAIQMNPETDFVPQGEGYLMLLYSDGDTVIELIDCEIEAEYQDGGSTDKSIDKSYSIRYREPMTSNDDCSATRFLTMTFDKEKKLSKFEISVVQRFSSKTGNKNEEQDDEIEYTGLHVISGDRKIIPYSCLLKSVIDNGDVIVVTEADRYAFVDLVNGKTSVSVNSIPSIVLNEKLTFRVQANGSVDRVYLLKQENGVYVKTDDVSIEELSYLDKGVYYVVAEVSLSGNCDADAPQNYYYYDNLFRLVVETDCDLPDAPISNDYIIFSTGNVLSEVVLDDAEKKAIIDIINSGEWLEGATDCLWAATFKGGSVNLGYCTCGSICDLANNRSRKLTDYELGRLERYVKHLGVPVFYYDAVLKSYPEGSPGVHYDGFNNVTVSPVTNEAEAIERAKLECTVEWDTTNVYYDHKYQIWMVLFSTEGVAGGCQSVYLSSNGKTLITLYGE